MVDSPCVVVIAGSVEGIDALARLIRALPATFPVPIVAYVHGLQEVSMARLMRQRLDALSELSVVVARDGDRARPGCLHVAPVGRELVFTEEGVLGLAEPVHGLSADHLFESAALHHGAGTIGVVLSGSGSDGTRGLRAITRVDGTRVAQSPSEASFASMPMSALLRDGVQHAVMLDQLGKLLQDLVARLQAGEGTA